MSAWNDVLDALRYSDPDTPALTSLGALLAALIDVSPDDREQADAFNERLAQAIRRRMPDAD